MSVCWLTVKKAASGTQPFLVCLQKMNENQVCWHPPISQCLGCQVLGQSGLHSHTLSQNTKIELLSSWKASTLPTNPSRWPSSSSCDGPTLPQRICLLHLRRSVKQFFPSAVKNLLMQEPCWLYLERTEATSKSLGCPSCGNIPHHGLLLAPHFKDGKD